MTKLLRVLMVEDSIADSEIILYELKKARLRIESKIVSSKPDFLREIVDFNPDIILSDFSMPSFDGLSALKITKKIRPEVPFVFVSGTIGEERAIEALKCGATDYILKDHLNGLIPKIKRALKEAKERMDKQEAERKLKKSQRNLTEAQRVAKMGNWEHDLITNEVTWSDMIYSLLGYDKNEITPSKEQFINVIHPSDVAWIGEQVKSYYETFTDFAYYCRINKHNTGELRYIYVKGKFKAQGEHTTKVFGIIQDVTELKETERQLKEINHELKTFIYKAHHDLRGPIASAIGLCNLSINEVDDSASSIHYLKMIGNCLKKLDSSINQLTEAMTIKDKRLTISSIKFQVLVNDILNGLKYLNGYNRVTFELAGLETETSADEKLVRTILYNLIENAIKYQNRANDPFVSIKIHQNSKGVTIEIGDNGIGIPEQVQPIIFDMFTRGHEESKGTGLGLYIVKGSIERLKGSIKMESKSGKGTKFTIMIPPMTEIPEPGDSAL